MNGIDYESYSDNEKIILYKELSKCKNYAISKSFRKFKNLPLERSDLETIAWLAFEETLKKYNKNKGNKKFESFFMDEVYWKCNDYCISYMNNRHKILNISGSVEEWRDADMNDFLKKDIAQNIAVRSVIFDYITNLENDDKKIVIINILNNFSIEEIGDNYGFSKSKAYRLLKEATQELKELLI